MSIDERKALQGIKNYVESSEGSIDWKIIHSACDHALGPPLVLLKEEETKAVVEAVVKEAVIDGRVVKVPSRPIVEAYSTRGAALCELFHDVTPVGECCAICGMRMAEVV